MKLLNLGCGATRPRAPWTNLDCLRETLAIGTPERTNLDTEPNYVEHRLGSGPLPFVDNTFDGILCSHVLEHFDCQEGVAIMRECLRVLKIGAPIAVSVPDASVFRRERDVDYPDRAEEVFGEPIHAEDGENTFAGYALWNRFHKVILCEDSLEAYFHRAGFYAWRYRPGAFLPIEMAKLINRRKFSLVMVSRKPAPPAL